MSERMPELVIVLPERKEKPVVIHLTQPTAQKCPPNYPDGKPLQQPPGNKDPHP